MLSESLSDKPRFIEARKRIPIIGKYLVPDEPPRPTGPIVIVDSRPLYSQVVTSTGPADRTLLANIPAGPESQTPGESGTTTHRRDRDIRFLDEV